MIQLPTIEGHIVLYCKNHYSTDVDFHVGLRRIWAIRCGLDEEHVITGQADRYIANELYKLFRLLNPTKAEYFHEIIHAELEKPYRFKDLTHLESLMIIYRSEISMVAIREKKGERYYPLVKLPKPKKKLFKRIIKGKGVYDDYKAITA